MSIDTFRQLLTEAGVLLPLQEVVEFEEGPSWVAAFDKETFVVLDWLDEPRRVVLHTNIGMLPSEEKARVAMLERVARYNAAWRETGGLRIGLDPDGTLTLLLDLPQAGLDVTWLCGVLRNFANAADGWREMRDGAAADEPKQQRSLSVDQYILGA